MKLTITTLSLLLSVTCLAPAGEKMSDAEIKQKLLGYVLTRSTKEEADPQ